MGAFGVAAENGSYVVVEEPPHEDTFSANTTLTSSEVHGLILREPLNNNTRITQGQCIEIGGVYDVSGVIGFTFSTEHNTFAYYGQYETAYDPQFNTSVKYLHVMPDARKAYYNFYVDPEIFGDRHGYWYQYTGLFERRANKRAFYVSDRCIRDASKTEIIVNNTPVLLNPIVIEPKVSGADILVSNDDPIQLPLEGVVRRWAFGDSGTKAFGDEINLSEQDVFTAEEIGRWSAGDYTIVLQRQGPDGIYGVEYESNTRNVERKDLLVPALRSLEVADVTGYQPRMIHEKLVEILSETDDVYTQYSVLVESPYVDITGYQEIQFANRSLLEVTGYTNKITGTPITFYIDRNVQTGHSDKYPGMTFTTENASIGDYRPFHGFIPLYYENLAPGFHSLTAVLPSGKSMAVDFYIREEPEQHYQQHKYFKFVDGNPFVPEPTPIIIEKEVVREVVKTEYKTIIEKEPVDYVTLAGTVISQMVIPTIAVLTIVGIPLAYLFTLVVRAFAERRKRNIQENSYDEK